MTSLGLLLWVGVASVHLYQLLHGHLHLPRLVVTGGGAHGARQLQSSHVGLHSLHVDLVDLLLRLLDHCLEIIIKDLNSKSIYFLTIFGFKQ